MNFTFKDIPRLAVVGHSAALMAVFQTFYNNVRP
jgi:hypothetical protein